MKVSLIALVLAVGLGSAASASPSPCRGSPPPVGATFRGPVLHVETGERLCVALGPRPDDWVALTLSGMPEFASRQLLMAVSFAEDVDCTILQTETGSQRAVCTLNGHSLVELAHDPGARERAKAWR